MAELTEAVAEAAEEVAGNAQAVADVSRSLSRRELGFAGFGVLIGGLAGGFIANRLLRTKWQKVAEEEIGTIRAHYMQKAVANLEEKPAPEKLVRDLGYISPNKTKEDVDATPVLEGEERPGVESRPDTDEDSVVAAVPSEAEEVSNIFQDAEVDHEWDAEVEQSKRSGDRPYVIHKDEYASVGYTETTLTYYAGDDVLCDEKDHIIEAVDEIVGVNNLERFGHGSEDPSIVYVRNDRLGTDLEVIKSEQSYAEEVHGFTHSEDSEERRRRTRMRFRDE